jgi:hypothetical protein
VRSLLIAGASSFDELYVHLRLLEPPFQTSVKDLRYVSMMPSQRVKIQRLHLKWKVRKCGSTYTEREWPEVDVTVGPLIISSLFLHK